MNNRIINEKMRNTYALYLIGSSSTTAEINAGKVEFDFYFKGKMWRAICKKKKDTDGTGNETWDVHSLPLGAR